jgi:hypothetical protein
MSVIGTVESIWRYPVKSMRGETLEAAFVGFAGVYGDRIYAFKNSAAETGFPYLTGREHRDMLLYQPRFRQGNKAAVPPNLAEAEELEPGLASVYAGMEHLGLDVETPRGDVLAIEGPELIERLTGDADAADDLSLLRSHRSMTDCRPVSLISVQTVEHLAEECGTHLDKRQFRANIYLDLEDAAGFAEDAFVGKTLEIGPKVVVSILERDPRCAMITLDPDTAKSNPLALRHVAKARDSMAGVYAAVLKEGLVRDGDEVRLIG